MNNEEIMIDEKEMVEYISSRSNLTSNEIIEVLDLEFKFLQLKGVIE